VHHPVPWRIEFQPEAGDILMVDTASASRRVLVPLDGSDFGEQALPWALSVAGPTGTLHLLHVVRTVDPAFISNAQEHTAQTAQLTAAAKRYLEGVAQRLGDRPGRVEAYVEAGRPGPTIARWAAATRADLIVLSTHGRGAVSRFWLGSAADHVVRESAVPVLVVRPDEVGPGPADLPDSIIILLDGSVGAEQALDGPRLLGMPDTTRIVLMQVVPTPLVMAPAAQAGIAPSNVDASVLESQRTAASDYLDTSRTRLASRGFRNVAVEAPTGGSVAEVVLERAKQLGNGLIALATHGRGGVARLIMGSVADKVIRSGGPLTLVYGHPS
jgi:nucleotide-binding universal stress UspA family protein